ncbi:glycosyltransferase family 4 protein [candidate division WOR-3 bacterium]|nr:glycosyltransferase family 4 protein [candidate division WOR-3 bacterium]
MKIAFINDQPLYSGMGKYAFNLYNGLKDKIDIDFLLLNYQKRRIEKIDGKIIAKTIKIPIIDSKPYFWHRMKEDVSKYDIYHFANQNLSFMITRKNSIVTCHDISPLIVHGNFFEPWFRRCLYSGLKKADMILADSFSTKKDLMKLLSIPGSKIKVIYLGIDHNLFKPSNKLDARKKLNLPLNKKIILNVGTEKRRRNIKGLIKAFHLLSQNFKEAILIRIGNKKKSTDKLINKLGLQDKVWYYTNISEQELSLFYSASDLFVLPSFYEGFGVPVLEAMACGVPVITSNISSLPEVAGNACIFTNPNSHSELANQMYQVLYNNSLKEDLISKGIDQASKFSWEKTVSGTVRIYKEFS